MNNKHLLTAFAVALLTYSSWRTWDYLSRYLLQDVSVTESMIIGAMFLIVTELGYLFWLHKGQPDATTDSQETVATVMVYTCLIGSLAIGLADLAVHNTIYRVDLSAIDPVLFFMPWFLVAANLIGYTIYFSGDSNKQLERADRQLKHEETKLEMQARHRAIDELRANMDGIAIKLAPFYYQDMVNRVSGRTAKRFEGAALPESLPEREDEYAPEDEQIGYITGNGNGNGRNF